MNTAENIYVEQDNNGAENEFAISTSNPIKKLLAERNAEVQNINKIAEMIKSQSNFASTLYTMLSIQNDRSHIYSASVSMYGLNNPQSVISYIDAQYWNRCIEMMNMYSYMSAERKKAWRQSIQESATPEFDEKFVYPTLQELVSSRSMLFAEKIDGVFKALSPDHLTNNASGFNAKVIINNVFDKKDNFHDLRCVVAKLLKKKEQPHHNISGYLLTAALEDQRGEWVSIDGGALEIKVHAVGTCHIKIHPEIAFMLNDYLLLIYPSMLPSEVQRKKLKKTSTPPTLIEETLSDDVLQAIRNIRIYSHNPSLSNSWKRVPCGYYWFSLDNEGHTQVDDICRLIGCVKSNSFIFKCEFDPEPIFKHIIKTGRIPDSKSHQFYETNEELSKDAVALADIQPGDKCLEPEAGNGALACLMPNEQTTCVEISKMRCEILAQKGLNVVVNADFLEFAKTAPLYHKIVMNPPFCNSQYITHVEAAIYLLEKGGSISAILPTTFGSVSLPDNFSCKKIKTYEKAFEGTNVTVGLYHIIRLDW